MVTVAGGCGQRGVTPPDGVARVGKNVVSYSDFEQYLESNVGLEIDTALRSEVLSGLFDQFLDEVLLRELAIDQGKIGENEGGPRVTEALLEETLSAPVPRDEIERYFRAHAEDFARPERVRLRQVLASDRAVAERIARDLAAGSSLAAVLANHRGSGESGVSGSQDELSRDDLPQAYSDLIFRLEPGEVSEIVAADYGFHVFQVVERLPAQTVVLETAALEITDVLRRQKAENTLSELVDEARRRYNVEVFARNLPFNYAGKFATQDATKKR